MERWHEALLLIDDEPAFIQQRPEVRYASAAAAEKVGDYPRVLELLDDLERELPILAKRIRERRARAALSCERAELAVEYFRDKDDPESRLNAAVALAALGDRAAARASLSALLSRPIRRSARCSVEARARRLLRDVLPAEEKAAIVRELRWLALTAPLCESARGADDELASLGDQHALDRRERMERARAFAGAGLVAETERELAALASARGPAQDAAEVLALRGIARYEARTELGQAAELLRTAAAMNPGRAGDWLYIAGRAHVRAGAAEPALEIFTQVRKRFPKTSVAEQAEYQSAQLLYSGGRFEEAVKAFDAYLARYGRRGRFSAEAEDERSIAWVVTGRAAKAAQVFAEMARVAGRRERARYAHLEGVAWLKAGNRERAEQRLQQVVRDYPLSFAALAATARLEALGVTVTRPALGADAQATAAALDLALPPEANLLHQIGLDREAELALQEVERTVVRAAPIEGERALCSLYSRLASAERCYRVGQGAATWEELNAAGPRSDRRWLWDCVYPRPYAELVQQKAEAHGLETELIYAVMRQESSFRPEVVSPAQAIGLLQILPSTGERLAREVGIDFHPERLREPPVNVQLGAHYLRKLLDVFDGSLPLAVASYNAGPNAVLRWLEGARGLDLDLFVARIPYGETRTYVERVVSNYARYRYLSGGEGAIPRLSLNLPTPKTEGVELY